MRDVMLVLAVAILGSVLFVAWRFERVAPGLDRVLAGGVVDEPVQLEGSLQTMPDYVDCWQYAFLEAKIWKCVYTTCEANELTEACEARHSAKVLRLLSAFPPCDADSSPPPPPIRR